MCKFIVITLFLAAQIVFIHTNRRIIYGEDAPTGKYPYVILIINKNINLSSKMMILKTVKVCTGSLITDQWILTAAHCFYGEANLEGFQIIFNNFTIPPLDNIFYKRILLGIHHHGYNFMSSGLHKNDIGLMKIEKLEIQPLGRISALDFKSLVGHPVRYLGFGSTVPYEILLQNQKKTDVITRNNLVRPLQMANSVVTKCNVHNIIEGEPAAMICLRPKCSDKHTRELFGDSGGPLLYNGKIVGVTLGGHLNGDYYHLAYTAVSPYLDWILKTIQTN